MSTKRRSVRKKGDSAPVAKKAATRRSARNAPEPAPSHETARATTAPGPPKKLFRFIVESPFILPKEEERIIAHVSYEPHAGNIYLGVRSSTRSSSREMLRDDDWAYIHRMAGVLPTSLPECKMPIAERNPTAAASAIDAAAAGDEGEEEGNDDDNEKSHLYAIRDLEAMAHTDAGDLLLIGGRFYAWSAAAWDMLHIPTAPGHDRLATFDAHGGVLTLAGIPQASLEDSMIIPLPTRDAFAVVTAGEGSAVVRGCRCEAAALPNDDDAPRVVVEWEYTIKLPAPRKTGKKEPAFSPFSWLSGEAPDWVHCTGSLRSGAGEDAIVTLLIRRGDDVYSVALPPSGEATVHAARMATHGIRTPTLSGELLFASTKLRSRTVQCGPGSALIAEWNPMGIGRHATVSLVRWRDGSVARVWANNTTMIMSVCWGPGVLLVAYCDGEENVGLVKLWATPVSWRHARTHRLVPAEFYPTLAALAYVRWRRGQSAATADSSSRPRKSRRNDVLSWEALPLEVFEYALDFVWHSFLVPKVLAPPEDW